MEVITNVSMLIQLVRATRIISVYAPIGYAHKWGTEHIESIGGVPKRGNAKRVHF